MSACDAFQNLKKVYGYLEKNTKALVKDIVNLLGTDRQISELYDTWYRYKCEIVRTYIDEISDKIPIEDNEEFKSIRNAVVKSAAEISSPSAQPDREIDYDYAELKERKNDFDYLSYHADFRDDPMLFYRLGRYYDAEASGSQDRPRDRRYRRPDARTRAAQGK